MSRNARMWFQCRFCPWKSMFIMTANTPRLIHSCMTLSCISENGPPLPTNPIRFAGTWQQYSKRAMPHENAMTPIIGHFAATPVACSFKCPYQARVMKTLLSISKMIVYNPFILFYNYHTGRHETSRQDAGRNTRHACLLVRQFISLAFYPYWLRHDDRRP